MEKLIDPGRIAEYQARYGLSDFFGQDMSPYMELFLYKKNETICMAEEDLEYFFLFVEGTAKVYTLLKNGKSLMLRFYHPFKVIGDVELMLGCRVSSCIQAISNVYCIAVKMSIVREKCLENPRFLKNIAESLAYKLATFSKRSSINQLYSLEKKLAAYILGSLKESGGNRPPAFRCNLTQLAELLGTSYRHLLRTLNQLSTKGILRRQKGCYDVLDVESLENMSADLYE